MRAELLKKLLTIFVFGVSQDQPTIADHCFKERMKLEAVDPAAPISIRPATVTKVTVFPISFVVQRFTVVCCLFGLAVNIFCSLPNELQSIDV